MAEEEKQLDLKKEDYDRIMAQPVTHIRISEKDLEGRYDKVLELFFLIDGDKKIKPLTVAANPKKYKKMRRDYDASHGLIQRQTVLNHVKSWIKSAREKIRAQKEKQEEKTPDRNGKWRKIQILLLVFAVPLTVALVIGSFLFLNGKMHKLEERPWKDQPKVEEQRTEPTQPAEEKTTSLDQIEVLQVQRDLVPGDVLRDEDLKPAKVSAEFYYQSTLNRETQFYQGSRGIDLVGKYITSYVQAGQYLSFGMVDNAYVAPVNPWLADVEKIYVTAKLPDMGKKLESVFFGSIADVKVTRTTIVEQPKSTDEESEHVSGVAHHGAVQQSMLVDTYSLENIVVCDILDKNRDSVWYLYSAWMAIPTGEQTGFVAERIRSSPETVNSLTPVYVKLQLTKDQADLLGSLLDDQVSVEFDFAEEMDIDTTEKAKTLPDLLALKTLIGECIRQNQEADHA